MAQCGQSGAQCQACSSARADTCGALGCQCGGVAQCASSMACAAGTCTARRWVARTTTGAIAGRAGAGVAYDSARQRVVLFGGEAVSAFSDTWEYAPATSTWTRLFVTGPAARFDPAMAYDPVRAVTVLFGGEDPAGNPLTDTWEWNGTAWTPRTPAMSPPPRRFAASWWDPVRARVAISGGQTFPSITYLADVWEWDGTSWTERTGLGTPARAAMPVAYDTARQRAILFGGINGSGDQADTWELTAGWSLQAPSTPPSVRHGAAMVYDPGSGTAMLCGGAVGSTVLGGAWTYDGQAWTAVSPNPGVRSWPSMVYDSTRSKLILFGGFTASFAGLADTWEY